MEIDNIFYEMLSGDNLTNALDFTKFLHTNDIIQAGKYEMKYRDKIVCYIDTRNETHSWIVWTSGDYSKECEDFPLDEWTKEIAWKHANKCGNCKGTN